MATPLSNLITALSLDLQCHSVKSSDLQDPISDLLSRKKMLTEFGTGVNQANVMWSDRRLLAAGADDSLDLGLDALTNCFGDSVEFSKVKAIIILNRTDEVWSTHTATTAIITVGGALTTPFQGPFDDTSDKISIVTGAMFVITNPSSAGWAVSYPSLNRYLLVSNDSGLNEAMYDIVLIGVA